MRSQDAVQDLKQRIQEYESDTFSASDSGVSMLEIDSIVAEIIKRAMDHLDGATIDSILFEIREGNL